MSEAYSGRCACGSVTFECTAEPAFAAVCHCLDCKRASGGEAAMFFGIPQTAFSLKSGEPRAFTYVANSGKRLDRNFCPNCGSRVFTSNLESFPQTVFIQAGSLDQPGRIKPMVEMFTSRRLNWVKPLDLPQYEGMPTG